MIERVALSGGQSGSECVEYSLNLMTLRLIPCFFMDLYNVFIFKSEWTYVTDCVDFSSVLHGLQMAEYSINCNWKSRE